MGGRFDDVAEDGQVRKQVQMLKDSANLAAQLFDPARILVFRKICIKMHVLAFDRAAVDAFEPVKTAQQSRLATARRANNSQNGSRRDFKRDTAQNARAVCLFDQIFDANHDRTITEPLAVASGSYATLPARYRERLCTAAMGFS